MKFHSSVLVIGSGIAGLSASLKLANHFDVSLITKGEAMEANTRYAQGGIASVTSSTDNFQSHIQDTLVAGAGLCNQEVVERIVKDGPRLIDELVDLGVLFSRKNKKEYDLGQEGGHSERRILHAGDITGNALESTLLSHVLKHPRIKVFEHHAAIDLITTSKLEKGGPNHCLGVYALNIKTGEISTHTSSHTLLATGGAGKVYLYTSNPDIATGDGMAMAYRAGATMANMEFVQFHPTCLYNPAGWAPRPGQDPSLQKTFLISEAVRGEGGILKRKDGTPFMPAYHPLADLAPRDIVARAIDFEMKKHGDDYVLLDISHKGKKFIQERFPNIYSICLKLGFDMTLGALPVVPAAHYFCGGVATDLEGRTSLPGLYAIGETACTGLHGANRLASNSLLEALAMADYCSQSIIKEGGISSSIPSLPEWDESFVNESEEGVVLTQDWDEIRRMMWNYVGIVRSDKRLSRAKRRIDLLQEEIREYYWNVKVTSDLIELRNVAFVAEMVIKSAMARKESRGLHTNIDYPQTKQELNQDTLIQLPIH